jgi:ABC-type Fe3+/spermidine/putrescine transport system ATPase subunit
VARFIGAANVINTVPRDESHVAFAGTTLHVVGAKLVAGRKAVVAIRQHDIELSTRPVQHAHNTLTARVRRQVFLGATRDYLVETADGTALRVVTARKETTFGCRRRRNAAGRLRDDARRLAMFESPVETFNFVAARRRRQLARALSRRT